MNMQTAYPVATRRGSLQPGRFPGVRAFQRVVEVAVVVVRVPEGLPAG